MKRQRQERRRHLRLALRFPAVFVLRNEIWPAHTRNISFGGTYLDITEVPALAAGEACRVQIALAEGMRIELQGEVCRVDELGLSVRFICTDLTSYEHLKAVMLLNCSDPDRLLQELKQSPGLTIVTLDACTDVIKP